jgi:hypothetical protein
MAGIQEPKPAKKDEMIRRDKKCIELAPGAGIVSRARGEYTRLQVYEI